MSFYEFCKENGKERLLEEWDREKNGEETPQTLSRGSTRPVWWRCGQGHSWQAPPYVRSAGKGCPYCAGRRVWPGFNDLSSQDPALAAQWDGEKNAPLTPEDVTFGSHKKAWWRCSEGHSWQAEIKSRASGAGCPVCSGRRTVSGVNDLRTKAPKATARWDKERNGSERPEALSAGSSRRAWWQCEKGHFWRSPIRFQSGGERHCPYCIGQKAWPGFNDLETVNPALATQWDREKNIPLTPWQVTASSQKRVWWRCELGHSFQARIAMRSRGTGCPYCTNRTVLAGFNDLKSRYPGLAIQWHPTLNGTLTPQQVVCGSDRQVWWQCGEGHVWRASICKRTDKARPRGCPVCAGKRKLKKTSQYDWLMAEGTLEKRAEPSTLCRNVPVLKTSTLLLV